MNKEEVKDSLKENIVNINLIPPLKFLYEKYLKDIFKRFINNFK